MQGQGVWLGSMAPVFHLVVHGYMDRGSEGVAAGCGVSQERTITCIPLPLRHDRTCLRERSEGRARQASVRVLSRETLLLRY